MVYLHFRMSKLLGFGDNQYKKYEERRLVCLMGNDFSFEKILISFLEILELAQNQFPNDEILKIEKKERNCY